MLNVTPFPETQNLKAFPPNCNRGLKLYLRTINCHV
jgi:hypothetical protein